MRYNGTKLAEETGQHRRMLPALREAPASGCVEQWDQLAQVLAGAKEDQEIIGWA